MNRISLGFNVFPELKSLSTSFEACVQRYRDEQERSNQITIFAQVIPGSDMEPRQNVCLVYNIFDFSSNVSLRGIMMSIETYPSFEGKNAHAIEIKNNFSDSKLKLTYRFFIRRDVEVILKAIQKIEKQLIISDTPLFSERKDWQFYYYGLLFELLKNY